MKKIITYLILALALCDHISVKAQGISFTCPANICFNSSSPASNTFNAVAASNTFNAVSYTWYVMSLGGNNTPPTITQNGGGIPGGNMLFNFSSCGAYSITCSAFNGTLTAYASATINVVCPNWINIINPANLYACAGSPLTIGANNSATGYSWTNGTSVISTNSIAVVSPTANACYTVTATQYGSGCTGSAVACVTVVTTPTLAASAISNNTNNCLYSTVTLSASGANTYTWSTSNYTYVPGATVNIGLVNACYTVNANVGSCTASVAICTTVQPGPAISVTGIPTMSVCAGSTVALFATGASNYTWSTNFTTVSYNSSVIANPISYISGASYTLIGNSGACNTQTVFIIPVTPSPSISLSINSTNQYNNNLVCLGSGVSMNAYGAASYTWMPGSVVGTPVAFFPTVNTCYTVYGSSGGCISSAVTCVTVVPLPPLTVSGNTTACLGSGISLSASGANQYYWYLPPSNTSTLANVSFTPSAPGQYTYGVNGMSNNGCSTGVYGTVTINAAPAVAISAVNPVYCLGMGGALLAVSGTGNVSWSTGSTATSISVTPTSSACYSVIVTNSSGCSATAVSCVTVQTATLTAGPITQTVCQGSSANLTASGANTYNWSNNLNTAAINVMPATSTNYTVTGTYANGCIGKNVLSVIVNTACSDVWPGDANSNGVVNSLDVFEIGFAYGNTGAARTPGGNAFISQYASGWSGTISTGKNRNHADCNGDGMINSGDTLAIYNNYSLTHAFKSSSTSSVNDINIAGDQNFVTGGQWAKANITLGDASANISQLYGTAFDVYFDQSMIVNDSIYIVYPNSFFRTSAQHVDFRKTIFNSGKLYTSSVRVNGLNVSGNGKIAELWFKVKNGLTENSQLALSLSNGWKTDNSGVMTPLTTGGTVLAITASATGIAHTKNTSNQIYFYPNPANNRITLQSGLQTEIKYTVFDITGRQILNGDFSNVKMLDLSEYANGTYIIRFESAGETTHKKFIIEK